MNTFPHNQQAKKRPSFVRSGPQGLERRLALAFWVMSFLPILLLVAAWIHHVDVGIVIYPAMLLVIIGYFFIARRMVKSMLIVAEKAKALSSGERVDTIELNEQSEIGELARSFNRINKDLQRKVEELESSRNLVKKLLSRIGTAFSSSEGIDDLLSLIIENTSSAVGATMASLMLIDADKRQLSMKTGWSINGQTVDRDFHLLLGDGIAGWVAKENRPMRSRSTADVLGFSHAGSQESAVLSVPLKLRDQPIGVMTVLRDTSERLFTEDDESLLVSIGSQVAVAIENNRLNLDVEQTYLETIMALALAVEAKDPYSAGHSKRVGYYAMQLGEILGLDANMLKVLNSAGVLHDIGKIGIKDEILLKTGALTPDEQKIMQQHPLIGEAIVKPVRSLSKVVEPVRCHHERFDGTGYPFGLAGEAIPLGARILSVVDTYDAMVTDRPYRKRLSPEQARTELKRNAGTQFDPRIVEAFLRYLDQKEQRLSPA